MKPQGEVGMSSRERKGRPWLRLLVVIAVILMIGLIANQLGLFDLLRGGTLKDRVERLDQMFESLGGWAPGVFILFWIVACVLLIPGTPITIAGALVFGAVWGSVYTAIGANIGACAAFLVGRYAARSMVEGGSRRTGP